MSVIQVTFLLCILYQVLGETSPNESTTPHQLIAQASNSFTLKMYNAVKDEGGNIFISPLSLGVLLAILHHGTKGAVANEIQRALLLPNNECVIMEGFKELIGKLESSDPLEIATKMFAAVDFRIKEKFLSDAQNYFYSGIDSLDFRSKPEEAVTSINSFVAEKTHDKITKLFDNLSVDTVLVLVNALYFKADWKYTFPPSFQQQFYITKDHTVDVDMMHITKYFNYKRESYLEAQLLEIPYKGDEYSMIIILPDDKEGLSSCENKIPTMNFENLTGGMTEYEVSLTMPKFKMEKKYELNTVLQKMGMTTMFQPGAADFSGITDDNNVYVSKAVQKTYINVDEKGTEAAAATGISVELLISASTKIDFIANHPFMFVIVHKARNTVLFMGRFRSAWDY